MWYSELIATSDLEDPMPWNRTTRKDYKRDGRRYESDVTDQEWATLEPMIPKQGRLGRPRQTDLREVFNAVEYVLATGCQWRALPRDFPPHSTVMKYFYRWQGSGVFDRMIDALRDLARAEAGRKIEPTAAIIDSQSVKTTESGGPRGEACPELDSGTVARRLWAPEPETFCGYRRLMTYGSDSKSLFLNKLSDFGEL
jgi:transposase